ncbi:MAG: hypothetical protein JO323_23435 [Acidobacteriia bacterium]|nr:hypothetical protein [Terriglobia bacterium]
MDLFHTVVNAVLRAFVALFSWAPPSVGLTIISASAGMGMLWVFRRTSDQARIRRVKKKVYAHLLEMRVYSDEPALTWRAQRSLLKVNVQYLLLTLPPCLFLAVPVAVLLIHVEAFYGRAPLELARPALVTAAFDSGPEGPAPELTIPPQFDISAPPVRVLSEHQVSWRVLPRAPFSGELTFAINGRKVTKRVVAGRGPAFVPGRRVRSVWASFWYPDEPHISAPGIEWIEVSYPGAVISVFGWQIPWLAWFVIVSMLSALLLKKRFGVTL